MAESSFDITTFEAEKIIAVGEKLIERHMQLGPDSPLQNNMIAALNAKISRARQKHDEGMKYKKAMEDALAERDNHLSTKDKSVFSTITAIVDILEKKENVDLNKWVC